MGVSPNDDPSAIQKKLSLLYNGTRCPVMSGRLRERSLPMDTQTVIALCDVFLVLIGIIGLVLVRRE